MADYFTKLTGRIDRRSPYGDGKPEDPILRENYLSRDGVLKHPQGTEEAITTDLGDIPRWIERYYSIETGAIAPKTFVYTQDGKMFHINDIAKQAEEVEDKMAKNAYPRSQMFKLQTQTLMYLVDGTSLWKHDGNNDHKWDIVKLEDSDGNSVNPIDVIEHKDRLCVISETYLFISKNLFPDVFDDATDSIQIVVGSGRGKNIALGKIEDRLYIFNTEGIFILNGDVISAVASTFRIDLIDERKAITTRSVFKVEKAILFVADDLELWSWDGNTSTLLSYSEKISDFINPYRNMLDKMVAGHNNHYYKLSVVENGKVEPNLEFWYDTLENKIEFVKGRHVSCYMTTDASREREYSQIGKSNENSIDYEDRSYTFDNVAIEARVRSRDITPKKGQNVRFTAFYPEIQPTGDVTAKFRYVLDGKLNTTGEAEFDQNLRGQTITISPTIELTDQAQFIDRIRPKINYAKGTSISFEISDSSGDLVQVTGIGLDFLLREKVKSKKVGA